MPMIELSASGVSSTRSSPNSAASPSVARNTPPRGPDVLAEDHHPVVGGQELAAASTGPCRRCCARCRPRAAAWRPAASVGSLAPSGAPGRGPQRAGEHPACRRSAGSGAADASAALGGRVDLGLHLGLDALLVGLGQQPLLDEVLRDPAQRVLLAPRLDLLRRAVGAVVVVGGVGEVAVGLALDEGRARRRGGRGARRSARRRRRRAGRCRRRSRRRSRRSGRGRRRRRPPTPCDIGTEMA